MKKFIFLIIIFFCATSNASAIIDNECIDNKQCLVLCNYKTTLNGAQKYSRNLTIYYNFNDKNISVRWQDTDTDSNIMVSTKTGAVDYVFSNAGANIYWGISESPTLSNFSCPANGYLDTSDLNSGNELCFDNDGTTCKDKYSNLGTAFAHHGGFVSEEKDYDIEDHVGYYSDWIFGDIKDDISNGTFDLNTDLPAKIQKDFKTNFLYNNEIPEFIANMQAYKDLEKNVKTEFEKAKAEALKESEEAVTNGEKTQEEHEQAVENWNVSPDVIQSQATMAFSNINNNVTWLADFNVSDYCESYLGNPSIKGKPAYYLQFIFDLIKYAAIILLLVLSIVEYVKATASSNQDAIKKATISTIKRLVIAIVIFMLPILIRFLLTILGAYSPGTCGIS